MHILHEIKVLDQVDLSVETSCTQCSKKALAQRNILGGYCSSVRKALAIGILPKVISLFIGDSQNLQDSISIYSSFKSVNSEKSI